MVSVGDVPLLNEKPLIVFKLRQFKAPVKVILPEPDPLSKNTLSADVGTDAPDAPPEDADQFVVLLVFQVPAPPTQ
jgi:hypothetical protein